MASITCLTGPLADNTLSEKLWMNQMSWIAITEEGSLLYGKGPKDLGKKRQLSFLEHRRTLCQDPDGLFACFIPLDARRGSVMSPSQRNRGTERSSEFLEVTQLRSNSTTPPEASALAALPVCTVPTAYQHTNTDTGGRTLGVMIHGAMRNVTVSVKMGVRGIAWARESRGQESCQGAFPSCLTR